MRINANETCLIVVDMLNDFVRKDGALVVQTAEELIPFQQQILMSARKAGIRVIY
jgi:nicotinamidase-related amidase